MKKPRAVGDNAQLTLKLTEALAQTVSVESFPRIMQVLCEELGWNVGEAWLPNRGRLQMSGGWHDLPTASGDLWISANSALAVHAGQGLVGGVWQSGEPVWISDVGQDESFVRAPFAQAAGLATVCIFPFRAERRVVGVGCLLARDSRMRDSRILDLLLVVGGQIGAAAQAYESAQRSERYFRDLTEFTNDILAVLAINGTIEYENSAAERLLGYQPRERIGRSVFDFIHPDDLPQAFDAFRTGMQDPGTAQRLEVRVRHRDGHWVWLESVGSIKIDKDSRVAIVASRDVTDRKRAELSQEHADARIRNLVNASPIVLFEFDKDGVYTMSEGGALQGVGRRPGEAVGLPVGAVYKDLPIIQRMTRMALGGETVTAEELVRRRWFRATIGPIYDDSGVIIAAGGVAVDVTELRVRQQFLEKQNSLLEALALGASPADVLPELACSLAEAIDGSSCVLWVLDEGSMKPLYRCGLAAGALQETEQGVPMKELSFLWSDATGSQDDVVSVSMPGSELQPGLSRTLIGLGIVEVWYRQVRDVDGTLVGVIAVNHFAAAGTPGTHADSLGFAARVMRAALCKDEGSGVLAEAWRASGDQPQDRQNASSSPPMRRTRKGKAAQEEMSLTDVQARLLRLISRGLSNDEIARAMGLSPHTIKEYVSVVSRSLGAKNRAHAVAIAIEMGLV